MLQFCNRFTIHFCIAFSLWCLLLPCSTSSNRHVFIKILDNRIHPLLRDCSIILQTVTGVGQLEIPKVHAIFLQRSFQSEGSLVGAEAGVGRASFYRNFESKEAVISRHLKTLLDNWWMEAIQKPDFNLIEAVFAHYWEHRKKWSNFGRKPRQTTISVGSLKDAFSTISLTRSECPAV